MTREVTRDALWPIAGRQYTPVAMTGVFVVIFLVTFSSLAVRRRAIEPHRRWRSGELSLVERLIPLLSHRRRRIDRLAGFRRLVRRLTAKGAVGPDSSDSRHQKHDDGHDVVLQPRSDRGAEDDKDPEDGGDKRLDGDNDDENQNFELAPWNAIADQIPAASEASPHRAHGIG